MIYLASPFSSPYKAIEKDRYLKATEYIVHCLKEKLDVFSPIVYCYPMHLLHKLPGDAEYWRDYNEAMMNNSIAMHVLTLDGWRDSLGVQSEIDWWLNHRPIYTIKYIEGKAPWHAITKTG